jgi:hypothetical protein
LWRIATTRIPQDRYLLRTWLELPDLRKRGMFKEGRLGDCRERLTKLQLNFRGQGLQKCRARNGAGSLEYQKKEAEDFSSSSGIAIANTLSRRGLNPTEERRISHPLLSHPPLAFSDMPLLPPSRLSSTHLAKEEKEISNLYDTLHPYLPICIAINFKSPCALRSHLCTVPPSSEPGRREWEDEE